MKHILRKYRGCRFISLKSLFFSAHVASANDVSVDVSVENKSFKIVNENEINLISKCGFEIWTGRRSDYTIERSHSSKYSQALYRWF